MLYIVIDGNRVPASEHEYLNNSEITYRIEDSAGTKRRQKKISYSKQMRFTGATYNYIKTKLIDQNTYVAGTKLIAEIFDTCCGTVNGSDKLVFTGKIERENIDWCEFDCAITCDLKEDSIQNDLYKCLENQFVWAKSPDDPTTDPNFAAIQHPFIRHCIEFRPSGLQIFFYFLAVVIFLGVFPLLVVVGAIVTVLNVIISAINVIIGIVGGNELDLFGDGDINFFDDINQFTNNVASELVGCGRGNPSPYLTSYLDHVCQKCGLTWQSETILQKDFSYQFPNLVGPFQPYLTTALYYVPVKKGRYEYFSFDEKNKPILTGATLSDLICNVFNGLWQIDNNSVLRIERRDYYEQFYNIIDVLEFPKGDIISLCYNYSGEKTPACFVIEYTRDGQDWVGNEALFPLYSDTISWNEPVVNYPNFEGIRNEVLPIGPVRFRQDDIEPDVLTPFQAVLGGIVSLFGSPQNGNPNLTDMQSKIVLMPQHQFSQYKFLPLDPQEPYTNAKVLKRADSNGFKGYNGDMWLSAIDNNADHGHNEGNLYTRFWYIEDSRLNAFKGISFELKLRKTCKYINEITLETKVQTPQGLGKIESITVGLSEITIEGKL